MVIRLERSISGAEAGGAKPHPQLHPQLDSQDLQAAASVAQESHTGDMHFSQVRAPVASHETFRPWVLDEGADAGCE